MGKTFFIIALMLALLFIFGTPTTAANCRLVSGKTYYTDGVGYFKDSICRQEMTNAELNANSASSGGAVSATIGSGNCRYNSTKMQYTDGVAFFTDNKCTREAIGNETAPAPTAQTASVATQTVTAAITSTQYTQLSQRIAALEIRLNVLQSIVAQILSLLAKNAGI